MHEVVADKAVEAPSARYKGGGGAYGRAGA
jgi:hypothetical protein